MGACLSCLPQIFVHEGNRRASAGHNGSRWRRRCQHFISCCGMCDALFQGPEEQASTSGPLLQSMEDSSTVSYSHVPLSDASRVGTMSSSLRHEKVGTNVLQTQIGETHYRSSGSGHCGEAHVIDQCKFKEYDKEQNLNMSTLPLPSKSEKSEAITSLLDDEDICPTCLDGYDPENPKIMTKCGHHFHLGCILEWMERSSHCPLCGQEMVYKET